MPAKRQPPELECFLQQQCAGDLEPHVLRNPSRIPGLEFESVLHLEFELDDDLSKKSASRACGQRVDQSDFPALLLQIRSEARAEFGAMADSPAIE